MTTRRKPVPKVDTKKVWIFRAAVWGVLAVVLGIAAIVVGFQAVSVFMSTAGHVLGLMAIGVIAIALLTVMAVYGFDTWVQAREVNRAVEMVDSILTKEKRSPTDAEANTYIAGAIQTAGLYILIGLVMLGLLFHTAHMVVPTS